MAKVKFRVHTVINPNNADKQREIAIEALSKFTKDPNAKKFIEGMADNSKDVTLLTYAEFTAWYNLMVVCIAGFKEAHKAWERDDYFVDPGTGNKVRVSVMIGNEEHSL